MVQHRYRYKMSKSNLLGLAGYGSEGEHTDTDDETHHLPKPPLKTKSLVEDYGAL